jgi:NADH-quinone oxidoreductase subunit G
MIRIFVNNIAFYIKKDISVLEALSFLGLRVPRFCYHEALSIAGNCRICLVETDSALKLVASCAQPVLANMQIFSNTVKVLKTRENILESLLINHPLDCPVCDQAGECDLQDQSKVFGGILTRHIFSKRGVENKIIDPCIKTIMTRCIHCTRCVRFASEITGKNFLGTLNRGRYTEIGGYINYLEDSSEVSGNVIDLCPVGALTAKPYAFKARPWELRSIETIDLTDGLGSNIYVNLKELQIISVLPKNNPLINGQWISNKARFYIDALQRYRISSGYKKENEISLAENTNTIIKNILPFENDSKTTFIVNEETDMNTLRLLKKVEAARQTQIKVYNISNSFKRSNYYHTLNTKVSKIETSNSSCYVLLASNIRMECAVINIKLRIKAKSKRIQALSLGQRMNSVFSTKFINVTSTIILNIIEGKDKDYSKTIFLKSQPIFLIGEAFFQRFELNHLNVISHLTRYNTNSTILIINKKINSESINFLNIKNLTSKILLQKRGLINFYALQDSLKVRQILNKTSLKTIWLNTHGSQIATKCDYILPILSYLEAEGLFMNLEKRPQKAVKIIENNSTYLCSLLEFTKIIAKANDINIFNKKGDKLKALEYMDEIVKNPTLFDNLTPKFVQLLIDKTKISGSYSTYPFKPTVSDYYLTNSYSKYSLNMVNYSNKQKISNTIFSNLEI